MEVTTTTTDIESLIADGLEDVARDRYTDRVVDDWFRVDGWDPDSDRGFVAEYDGRGMVVNGD